ncbi:MAG: sulfotransferase family 2 domain-containing protein [Gammaproteobacteria bacterium]|jgi:hypothetical protein|nr:sulfotransferase family 2 domain-containing protein [Gammaproteobacteria bacterium]MBT5223710.1 sulfotransferase family 2 domain-containing protein [Gammaproteobacteria bacterium]MBT5824980.1 sulfotransferase family 2 domain-containing protein [Gammaproteobacteria bacterium]MBT5965770.1 sulfotransferase family 2 domain-containing protein [Gammaproteobacteria bacterium]MBT6420152.1 sulfotransferase family 2 domain-containing protein [Gammaproteobacteria bacterium]
MLILPKSCFLHVAKTGGSWVKKAIIASGIEYEDYRVDGNPHVGLSGCPVPDKFKFAFVRHPVDLYRSYWQFKMTHEWDVKNQLDMECKSDDFNDFIRNVLDKYPGCFGDSLIDFVGDRENEIEFVGKYENLVEDLILMLRDAGEVFDEGAIRNLPAYNVSDKTRFPAIYTANLKEEVRRTEINVMQRFGYD